MTLFVYLIVGTIMCFHMGWSTLTILWCVALLVDIGVILHSIYNVIKQGKVKETNQWNWDALKSQTLGYKEGYEAGKAEWNRKGCAMGYREGYREGRFDEFHADEEDNYIQWYLKKDKR